MEALRVISKVHTPAHVFVCVYIHVVNYFSVSYPFNCIHKFIEMEFLKKKFETELTKN